MVRYSLAGSGDQQGGPRRAMRFLVSCRVVFSEILTTSSSARKDTMVLCG